MLNFYKISFVVGIYITVLLPVMGNTEEVSKPEIGFIENKGQIYDQNNVFNANVKYLLSLPGMNVQLRKMGFSYDTYVSENTNNTSEERINALSPEFDPELTIPTTPLRFHRVDIELVNSNPETRIVPEFPSSETLNFYNQVTPEEGALGVKHYNKITYKNIYPNIDLEFLASADKRASNPVKYNFIIRPGGDPSDIVLEYKGLDRIQLLETGELQLYLAHGSLQETIPLSYVGEEKKNILVKYRISENSVRFDIPTYDRSKTLIIDPTPNRLWGTYYGGTSTDPIFDVVTDGNDNILATGTAQSSNAVATAGSHQSSYAGNNDGFVVKFNSSGVRQWATYYGGTGSETSISIDVDGSDNVLVTGYTATTGTAPNAIATSGAQQTTSGGGTDDGFVVKFNSSGVRQWGTYLGDAGTNANRSIAVDGSNNIIVLGYGNSAGSAPNNIATAGAHMTTSTGSDSYLVKYNSSGVRQWGTYYGGNAADQGQGVDVDPSGNIYISGKTASTTNMSTGGAHQTSNGGGTGDLFIAKFNGSGVRQWGTYYGGTGADGDGILDNIAVDASGNVYVTGVTTTTGTGPNAIATAGSHQATHGGGGFFGLDMFLVKFNTSGVRQWGTYYGGSQDDAFFGTSIDVDPSGEVYMVGSASSTNNIATAGAYQTTFSGANNAVVVKFNTSGVRQWGTYYGGSTTYGYGITTDNNEGVIVVGYTTETTSATMTSAGAHQTTFGGGGNDAFVVKFDGGYSLCGGCTSGGSGTTWTWTGCIDTDWFNPCNWDRQTVPDCDSDVVIPFTANNPLITGATGYCNTKTIAASAGAELTIDVSGGGDCVVKVATGACP